MNIKYVVVSQRNDIVLFRFEGPRNEIQEDKKLPSKFQQRLFGPSEWLVMGLLSDESATLLEGVATFVGVDMAQELAQEIFGFGYSAGKKAAKSRSK